MSQHKFASNVIDKCLSFGTPAERQTLVNKMLGSMDENDPLQVMMKDQFANYVVQKVLETCDDQQLELVLNRIKIPLECFEEVYLREAYSCACRETCCSWRKDN